MRRIAGIVLLAAFAASPASADSKAFIYDTEGKVNFVRDRRTLPLQIDKVLLTGDALHAYDDGSIDMNLYSWVGVRLLNNTVCVLKTLSENDLDLELEDGALIAYVKKKPGSSRLVLETPVMFVTAENLELRSDRFLTMYLKTSEKDGRKTSTFAMKKGEAFVTFRESDNSVRVLEGEAVDFTEGGFVSSKRAATEEELALADKSRGVYIEE